MTVCIKIDGFCIINDEFCIQNDDLNANIKESLTEMGSHAECWSQADPRLSAAGPGSFGRSQAVNVFGEGCTQCISTIACIYFQKYYVILPCSPAELVHPLQIHHFECKVHQFQMQNSSVSSRDLCSKRP